MSLKDVHFRASFNFLGIPEEDSRYEDAKAVVVPVPYDSTTSYRAGTREGPQALIAASRQVELYDLDLGCEPLVSGIHTLPELETDTSGPEGTINNVEAAIAAIYAHNKLPVMFGGEHSITTGAVRAAKNKYKDSLSVLQLDAHSDMRDEYENTIYNHACVMRRVLDLAPVTQVGIRNSSIDEMEFFKEINHDGIFWAHEIMNDPSNAWMDRVVNRLSENVYLTIDLDAFDCSIMPAVGTPEPGGMLWYQTLELLNRVIDKKNVIGLDIVELCPIPGNIAPDFLAAKLTFKILGRIFKKNGWVAE